MIFSIRLRFLRSSLIGLTMLGLLVQSTGCGTLLHPERRGQRPGRIDPAIAILDGVGLLLFLVPGLIAFAVDFSTGAIYLPPEGYSQNDSFDPAQCEVLHVPPGELTPEKIEAVLSEHTGKSVKLNPSEYQVKPLNESHSESIKVLGQSE